MTSLTFVSWMKRLQNLNLVKLTVVLFLMANGLEISAKMDFKYLHHKIFKRNNGAMCNGVTSIQVSLMTFLEMQLTSLIGCFSGFWPCVGF